ncbi:Transcriptional regulatory protein BtsR [Polaribacter huanghezhanensis]|uniref:LytR/AlgR family response regulator transcription factor n=1 Tax=Polaribacter huanghezhanensis TaxID=1354726 RepID=UPI0026498A5C|nr:LytTR family transcriptional regulator DNA-binding domain-containing protein [Polaribacter huanghezhanensis]WKD85247.1 Transcriptional regulatory protein BtsR [Polaribacter huanghezhanensis]
MDFSTKKYKYIIVDSQIEDTRELKQQLESYPNYYCVGIAKNESEAINLALEQIPNLVFLNTELEVGLIKTNSFNMIHELHQYLEILPKFIAISSSTNHSYQAIKNGVFDYLLKPFNYFDLKKSLLRFEKSQPESSSICLKSFTEYRFLVANDIIYLKADNNTTDFYLKDGSVVTSCQTLKNFETTLPNVFVRIHKSYMVNVNFISKIHFSKYQCILKFTKQVIPFSKRLKSEMLEIRNFLLSLSSENHVKTTA